MKLKGKSSPRPSAWVQRMIGEWQFLAVDRALMSGLLTAWAVRQQAERFREQALSRFAPSLEDLLREQAERDRADLDDWFADLVRIG